MGLWDSKTKCARRADIYGTQDIMATYGYMFVLLRSFPGRAMTCFAMSCLQPSHVVLTIIGPPPHTPTHTCTLSILPIIPHRVPEFWNFEKTVMEFWNSGIMEPRTNRARRTDIYGSLDILDIYEYMLVLLRSFGPFPAMFCHSGKDRTSSLSKYRRLTLRNINNVNNSK